MLCVAIGFGILGLFLGILLTSLLAINKDGDD